MGLKTWNFQGMREHHIDERACGNSRAGVNYKKVEFPWVIMVFDLLCSWIFQVVPHDLAKFSRGASLFSLEFLRVKWHLKIPHGYVLRRTIHIPHLHLPPLMTVTVIAVYYFWLDHKKSPILDVRVLNMPLEYSVFQEQKGLHLY